MATQAVLQGVERGGERARAFHLLVCSDAYTPSCGHVAHACCRVPYQHGGIAPGLRHRSVALREERRAGVLRVEAHELRVHPCAADVVQRAPTHSSWCCPHVVVKFAALRQRERLAAIDAARHAKGGGREGFYVRGAMRSGRRKT